MILMNTKAAAEWSPPWRKDAGKPVYLFRAGSVVERAMMEADLGGGYDAGRVFDFELRAAFERGVDHLLGDDPDGAARLKDLHRQADGGELPDDEVALLAQARALLAQHWPDYRILLTRAARRQELSPMLAFQHFCVGWSGGDLPMFATGPDGKVRLDLLSEIPAFDLKVGGTFAFNLQYGSSAEKNSAAPSKYGGARLRVRRGSHGRMADR